MKRLLSSRTRDMRRRSQPRPLYDDLEARDCRPIIPPKLTPDVKREPDTARVRAPQLDTRGSGLQAARGEVALSYGRVRPRLEPFRAA
jgi:hypothetical protein